MQGTNQDAYRPVVSWYRTMQIEKVPTLEPDNVTILFCDSTFCDYTIGTLPCCSVEDNSSGVQHAVKPTKS